MKDGDYMVARLANRETINEQSCEYGLILAWANQPMLALEALECRAILMLANMVLPDEVNESVVAGRCGHGWLRYNFACNSEVVRWGFDTLTARRSR